MIKWLASINANVLVYDVVILFFLKLCIIYGVNYWHGNLKTKFNKYDEI